jgi:hypothetical protein
VPGDHFDVRLVTMRREIGFHPTPDRHHRRAARHRRRRGSIEAGAIIYVIA